MSAAVTERAESVPAVRIGSTRFSFLADLARNGAVASRADIAFTSFVGENLVPSGKITSA